MVTHDINSARRGNRIIYVKDGEMLTKNHFEPDRVGWVENEW